MKRKLGSKGQVVIPREVREKLGLREGEDLAFEVSGNTILVRREPSPEEIVERFLSVKGRKRLKLMDWKSVIDEEYKVPGR